jgi:hypothetical protein
MQSSAADESGTTPSGFKSLIEINGLMYMAPMALALATSRVTREWDLPKAVYRPGETLPFPLPAGQAFVDPKHSYIRFDVVVSVTNVNPDFTPASQEIENPAEELRFFWSSDPGGRGTSQHCFRSMRLAHSTGYEMDRLQDSYAVWNYYRQLYTKTSNWFESCGSLMRGYQLENSNIADALGTLGYKFTQLVRDGTYNLPMPREDYRVVSDVTSDIWLRSYTGLDDFEERSKIDGRDRGWTTGARPFRAYDTPKKTVTNPLPGGNGFTVSCAIPLCEITDIFNTDKLMPPSIVSGARLELVVADLVDIFTVRSSTKGDIPAAPNCTTISTTWYTVEIHDPKIVLETVLLADAAHRAILDTAADTGLELLFHQVHVQRQPGLGSDRISIAVNRGLSRAVSVNVLQKFTARTPWNDSTGESVELRKIQTKLGAEFMPSRPYDRYMDQFHATQTCWNNFRSDTNNTVTFRDFIGTNSIYSQTLEKSSTLRQSGAPIAANRDLRVEVETDIGSSVEFTTFVVHAALLTGYNQAVVLRL